MFRSAGKIFGAAAGVAASGPPSQSQCRAQQPRRAVAYGKEDGVKAALLVSKPAEIGEEVDNGWLLTEWQENAENGQSILDPQEIDDTLQDLLPPLLQEAGEEGSEGPSCGRVLIKELNKADSDVESVDSEGADVHMQAAESRYQEVQTVSTVLVARGFKDMVSNVMQDPSFQVALIQSLRKDPNYQEFLGSAGYAAPGHAGPPRIDFIPPPARLARDSKESGGRGFFQDVANGILGIAQAVGSAALGARDAIGKLFADLGSNILNVLNKSEEEEDEAGGSKPKRNDKGWEKQIGNIVGMVAIAAFTLIVLKKVHMVRFR